jgi:hypothetical protein
MSETLGECWDPPEPPPPEISLIYYLVMRYILSIAV